MVSDNYKLRQGRTTKLSSEIVHSLQSFLHIFTARRYASVVYTTARPLSLCLPVHHKSVFYHAKRPLMGSRKQRYTTVRVGWSLTALSTQFRSYCAFKVELYYKYY